MEWWKEISAAGAKTKRYPSNTKGKHKFKSIFPDSFKKFLKASFTEERLELKIKQTENPENSDSREKSAEFTAFFSVKKYLNL